MPSLSLEIKERAQNLRSKGYSVKEIADKLGVAKSTSSLWVRNVKLNKRAKQRLKQRKLLKYYKGSLRWQEKRNKKEQQYQSSSFKILKEIQKDPNHIKLYCALLYWCEGSKNWKEPIRFVNSDPALVSTFLNLFRKAFRVDEKKFRVLMHLHEYHHERTQKNFWSNLTKIPTNQFNKTFHKSHTKKRIRENYPGCVAIYYYDCKIARELRALYEVFAKQLGAW